VLIACFAVVTKELVVKLSDLGEARSIDRAENDRPRQFPRNINWSSPEVLNSGANINSSADVWSLALVITEIFTGNIPFDTEECRVMSFDRFNQKIEAGMRPEIPPDFAVKHPWFMEMVSSGLRYIIRMLIA
jgi:serine/threonine protein kinase